jgi:uncharacterized protein (TIGR02996 family)
MNHRRASPSPPTSATSTHEALLRAIGDDPDDDGPRLVYADWLEEYGLPERAELILVCEAMRRLPVFADDYWRLKARRDELRPKCPTDWRAATGYDGSRYDPVFRDGIPPDVKGRWRLIRAFAERWHGLPLGDVGGRRDEIRAVEARLGRQLPPSVREYVAYAHDVAPPGRFPVVHRDVYTMQPLNGQPALSIMEIGEGDYQWAIRDRDLGLLDPPVYGYYAEYAGGGDEALYQPAEQEGPEDETLTEFVLGFVEGYKPDAGRFRTTVRDPGWLREQLANAFPVRLARGRGTTYEGDGILVDLYPAHHGPGFDLGVCVHRLATWERVPGFLWPYARHTHMRGGMFLSEQDREQIWGHGGDRPPAELPDPPPPPLRGPAAEAPPGLVGEDDIPF